MKSTGTPPKSRHAVWSIAGFALGAALTVAGASAVTACVAAGECTDDCAEGSGSGGGGGNAGGGKGGGGGSGGGSGGSGGSSGGSGGASGGSGGGAITLPNLLETAVADCEFQTVKEVEEKLLVPQCGNCHFRNSPIAKTDLKTAKIYERLFDKAPQDKCKEDKLLDPQATEKSVLLVKLDSDPKCSNGEDGGDKMPPQAFTEAQKTCLTEYVKAIAAAANP